MRGTRTGRLATAALALALAVLAATLGVPAPAHALEADAPLDVIEQCVSKNLRGSSSMQSVELIPRDRLGSERTIAATVYWKRFDDGLSRVRTDFTSPEDINGAKFLLEQTKSGADMFLYMPTLRKSRRITGQSLRGQIYGTDFSYEDFERLQGVSRSEQRERLADGDVAGRATFVIEARPDPETGSAYERIVTQIDQERCVPLKTEFYEAPDRLRKVLISDPEQIKLAGESWLPHELVMNDLKDETQTRLRVLEVELGKDIPNKFFRLDRLGRKGAP